MTKRPLPSRVTRTSGVTPPVFCALVALLFGCALNARAGDGAWRETVAGAAHGYAADAQLDDDGAATSSAINETRQATSINESRERTRSGTPAPRPAYRTTSAQLRRLERRAPGRIESPPMRRFLVCGYMSAPPTAPPASAPLS